MKRLIHASLIFSLSVLLLGAKRPVGLGDIDEIRHFAYADYTRVVVQLSRSTEVIIRRLAANPKTGENERLFFDLPGVWAGKHHGKLLPVSDGLLQQVRVGQNSRETARVVLDLQDYDHHRLLYLQKPMRIVLDVFGKRRIPTEQLVPDASAEKKASQRLARIQRIVIDPGHGGRDPGAVGPGGLLEKKVTLSLAKRLRSRLQKKGFEVVLTREKDLSVSLEERTARAEAARADLFLSLHVNAAPQPELSGIETYYLDQRYEGHTAKVAARENGVDEQALTALDRTLAQLRIAEVSNQSKKFAETLHGSVIHALDARYEVRSLGVKTGPFYVLFLSSMPSVLVEAGFLSNQREARRLKDPAYLDAMADALAAGIARYQEKHAATMARYP